MADLRIPSFRPRAVIGTVNKMGQVEPSPEFVRHLDTLRNGIGDFRVAEQSDDITTLVSVVTEGAGNADADAMVSIQETQQPDFDRVDVI